jgi:GNAT superfamily N-acetyltransferase
MPLQLAPAGEADLPKILEVQYAAFAQDPINRLMFPVPTPPSTFEKSLDRARRDISNPDVAFMKVTETETGEIVSFAKWYIYKHQRPEEEWNKEEKRDWGEGTNVEVADTFFGLLTRNRRKFMAGEPYCCKLVTSRGRRICTKRCPAVLNLLDTLPAHQRRGAGTKLLRWCADVADQYGLPIYLEASPAGYHLYRKFGFEDVENIDMDLTRWGGVGTHRFACMIRPVHDSRVQPI